MRVAKRRAKAERPSVEVKLFVLAGNLSDAVLSPSECPMKVAVGENMMKRTVLTAQTATLRDLLKDISDYAWQARQLDPHDDNLPDRIDDIDNELQKVIELVNNIRRGER